MADDIAALGLSVDSAPVTKAVTELNKLSSASKEAQTAATALAGASTKAGSATATIAAQAGKAAKSAENLGGAASGSVAQMLALQHAARSMAEGLATGIPVTTILAQQLSHLSFVASSGGGLSGAFRSVVSAASAVLTPFRLAAAAAIALGAAAVIAANQWTNAQNTLTLAISGIGSASGVTVAQINAIALATADAGKATVGEAQQMAGAFVATGRVTADIAAQAVLVGRNVSKVFGEDIAASAERLAKALADPAKGVDDLNRRLGTFDDATAQHIKHLAEQGRFLDAQKILLDGVARATAVASSATGGWANKWEELRAAASKYWAQFSAGSARAMGMGTLEEQKAQLQKNLDAVRRNPAVQALNPNLLKDLARDLDTVNEKLAKLAEEQAAVAKNRDSNTLGDLIRQYVGEGDAIQRLIDLQIRVYDLQSKPGVVAGLEPTAQKELEILKNIIALKILGYKTAIEKAQEEYDIGLQSINARTAQQKGDLAYRQALARFLPEGDPNALYKAESARSLAIIEFNKQIRDTQNQQVLASQQKLQTSGLELSLVGKTTAEQERALAILQVEQQLKAESLRLYGTENLVVQEHLDKLKQQAIAEAEVNRLIKERKFYLDLQFERDQNARAPGEQATYAKLQAAGLLTNGQIVGATAEAAAAQVRLGYLLQKNQELSREFAGSFVQDMMAGKKASEALANALNKLAQRLADIGLDYAFQSLFGGKKGINSGLGSLLGFGGEGGSGGVSGGGSGWDATVVPSYHSGGVVGQGGRSRSVSPSVFAGAGRYHSGGMPGLMSGEVAAILQKGEMVLPKGFKGGGGVTLTMPINIDARGSTPDTVMALRAELLHLTATLPQRIVKTMRDAHDRGTA